ncbi:MAG: diguanylate cyclase, partial [Oscillospiraceae bacterium]
MKMDSGRHVPLIPEEYLSFVNQSISGGIVCLFPDADCTVYFINDSMLAMLGYTREEFFSETQGCFVQLIHPDDRAAAYAYVEKILAHGGDTCRRYRLITRAGEALWIRDTARPLLTSDGQHLLCCLCVDVTGETRLQRQLELEKECLRISEESYRIAVSHSSKLVHRYYVPTHTILFDPASTTLLGLPERVENVPESLVQAGRVAPESVAEYVAFYDRINAGEPTGRCVVNFRKKDGIYAWFLLDDTLVYDEAKHPLYAIVSYEDITDSRERELAYEKCQQAFSSMPPESIIYYEFNLTRNLCEREEGALVYHLFDQFKGSWTDMISYGATCFTFEEDRTMFREFFNREHLLTAFSTGETGATLDYRILGERNRPKWVHATLQMVRYPYSTDVKAYLLVEDIDIRKRNELRLQTLSQEDALTGVLNRAALVEKVTALLTRKTSHMSHAVMMLDLDGFKNINDCLGHMEGDRVLIEVARRLRTLLRANDIIGRIGGDELMVCLENIPSDVVADKRAHLMCQAICQKLGGNINLSASLGIALCPRDGTDFDTLYNHADLALYCAKRQGGNCHVFYQPDECLTPSAGHDPVTAPDHDPVLNKEKKKCHSNVLLGDEERYRILTQYANGGTFSLDLTTGQFSSSESLTDYCLDGEDLEALLQGRFDSDWVHPQDQKEVMSGLMRRLQNGVARTQVTVRLKKSDGSYDWCHLTTICLRNNEGLLQRIVGALAHVEYAQENAQIQLDTLRRLIDGGCLLLEVGDSIRQIASSAGYQKLVDGTSEYQDSRAQNGRAIFASDLPRLLHSLRDAAQTNGMVECVYRCYALQGQRLDWRRLRAMRMPFQQTDHPVLIAIVTDATPFKKQEECLNLTRKHLNGILEMSKLTAFDVDLDTHTLTRSPETVAQFGVDRLMMDDNPDSLIRSGVIHSDSAEAFCTLHHDIYARIPQGECMVKARKADGHYVSLQISYQGILDDSGRMRRAFGMAKETDNVTRAQLRFAREEKLWAMPGEDLVLTARINLSRSRVEASQINPRYLAAAHLPDQYEQLRQWVLTCVPDAQERARTMQRLSIAALKQRDRSGRDCAALELRHLDANGRLFWASLDVQLLTNPDNGDLYAFFYLRDIDARKMMELDLAVRIKRDRVCQVYDRETMLAMANATSLASQVAVIAMELADACLLRERLGTTKTDQQLALSARKLRMSLPTQCLIGAMGKGSFAILTTNVSSREHVEATVRRMLQILKSPALLLEPE